MDNLPHYPGRRLMCPYRLHLIAYSRLPSSEERANTSQYNPPPSIKAIDDYKLTPNFRLMLSPHPAAPRF